VAQVASGDETVESPTVGDSIVERDASQATTVVERGALLELPYGSAITSSGRISSVSEPGELSVHYPFPIKDLVILDDALKYGSRGAKARFAVYLGDLGSDTAATAREILAKVPTPDNAVLLAVSPNQKAIEVVYGGDVKGRGIEEAAPLGVSAAAASFAEGNLLDGLVSAIRVLSAAVSPR
jgi:Domain of unknown function (DUF5130)